MSRRPPPPPAEPAGNTLAGVPRTRNRMMPWRYPHDELPSRWSLAKWRLAAVRAAREAGAVTACGICKRPTDHYGFLVLRHPRSMGRSRRRRVCRACADLLGVTIDVLEWYGVCDNLPAEVWRPAPTPDEVESMLANDRDPREGEPNKAKR